MKSPDQLILKLRIKVNSMKRLPNYFGLHLWKDLLAKEFQVPEHEISQVMHVLNLEGLVSQEKHAVCHDYGGHNKAKCWHSDYYIVRTGNVKAR